MGWKVFDYECPECGFTKEEMVQSDDEEVYHIHDEDAGASAAYATHPTVEVLMVKVVTPTRSRPTVSAYVARRTGLTKQCKGPLIKIAKYKKDEKR